jgi:hypothetical protein
MVFFRALFAVAICQGLCQSNDAWARGGADIGRNILKLDADRSIEPMVLSFGERAGEGLIASIPRLGSVPMTEWCLEESGTGVEARSFIRTVFPRNLCGSPEGKHLRPEDCVKPVLSYLLVDREIDALQCDRFSIDPSGRPVCEASHVGPLPTEFEIQWIQLAVSGDGPREQVPLSRERYQLPACPNP